ncbi:MAG TPA: FtsX-like permease family protein [Rhodanobacteraceae bacterium]|nr:FtsX-like permease family protein [Rhodanobacteraceae bacterium]
MNMPPILAALGRHKPSVALITLQVALTLAIVCNAVFVIGQRVARVSRPTGLDENNLIFVHQHFMNAPSAGSASDADRLDSLVQQDMAALRGIPGVKSVASVDVVPLSYGMLFTALSTKPKFNQKDRSSYSSISEYTMGAQGLSTLGLKLVAGRNFRSTEVQHGALSFNISTPVIMITRAVARHLFPDGKALGKTVYLAGKPSRVIGVLARLQTQGTGGFNSAFAYNSVVLPYRMDWDGASYAIRTQPGQLHAVMQAVRKTLYKVNPLRVIEDSGVQSFGQIRASAYKSDIGMAILMGVICMILLCITGAGMVGITSFWVNQRRKQIGIRRALGATRRDILRYFQLENLMIAGTGVVLGALLGIGLNLWLMKLYSMDRMPVGYVAIGVILLLLLGQIAVFAPARRASNVPPVVATRSV